MRERSGNIGNRSTGIGIIGGSVGRRGTIIRDDESKSVDNLSARSNIPSRQSLLDLVSSKFMGRHTPTHHYYHHQQQVCQQKKFFIKNSTFLKT